jgi:hypothetical protein
MRGLIDRTSIAETSLALPRTLRDAVTKIFYNRLVERLSFAAIDKTRMVFG